MATSMLRTAPMWAASQDTSPQNPRITGHDSLKSHAHKHGLLTGFAVNVELLTSNPASSYPKPP